MKPLPRLDDEAAMLTRGKRSALGSARNDAAEALRDAVVGVQSADWAELRAAVDRLTAPAERLRTLAAMWGEL